jgi:hypothetical protein
MPLLNSLATEAKLIQVTSMAIKYAHKIFLYWIGGFFPHTSLGVEGWLQVILNHLLTQLGFLKIWI